MTEKRKIACYEGPPIWFLPSEWSKIISTWPQDKNYMTAVRIFFTDNRYVDTAVAADVLVELPDPYTTRDIARINRLV